MISGRVHVSILNWRSARMSLRATEAALRAMNGVEGAVTLIDNASGDGSFEAMSAHAVVIGDPRLHVRQSGRNGGFGAGNNAAIRSWPDCDYVLLVNSDAFADPDMIVRMRNYMDANPQVGLLGCHVRGEDGVHHNTHFRFPTIAGEFEDAAQTGPLSRLLSRWIVSAPMPERAGPVDWVAGASLMIRTEVLRQIGCFDETFFLYFEETDLCLRAARAGWPTHYLPDVGIVHVGSVSTGMKDWTLPPDYWFASREHYYRRNHGRAYAAMATIAHLAGLGIRRLRGLTGKPARAVPKGQARALIRHAFAPTQPRQIVRLGD